MNKPKVSIELYNKYTHSEEQRFTVHEWSEAELILRYWAYPVPKTGKGHDIEIKLIMQSEVVLNLNFVLYHTHYYWINVMDWFRRELEDHQMLFNLSYCSSYDQYQNASQWNEDMNKISSYVEYLT
ncbi:hypothetical protein L2089_15400 [Paenibacillus hunanensis]|uniref:hypothetical protein n=1 Tax=Paenibacillus hunanensis TaxID=539262 RepID=UPI002026C3F9|nr:hypothetical protein [Paenibacillus hunanensis]MCL9662079.1 hypothetical protein [Paenibacillus hunanensis]